LERKLTPEKSQTMAVLGQDPVRRKFLLDNKCLQQVKNFKYLASEISCENDKDIQQKTRKICSKSGVNSW
jgi:hypothetical protein